MLTFTPTTVIFYENTDTQYIYSDIYCELIRGYTAEAVVVGVDE